MISFSDFSLSSSKASNELILQNICSWGYGLLENRNLFLQNFEKALLENLICFYVIFLLENLVCSNEILDKILWKIWSVLKIFSPPRKSYVFLQNFKKALLEILLRSSTFCFSWKMCSCNIFGSPGKFDVF